MKVPSTPDHEDDVARTEGAHTDETGEPDGVGLLDLVARAMRRLWGNDPEDA